MIGLFTISSFISFVETYIDMIRKKLSTNNILLFIMLVSVLTTNYIRWVAFVGVFICVLIKKRGKFYWINSLELNLWILLCVVGIILGMIYNASTWHVFRDFTCYTALPLFMFLVANIIDVTEVDDVKIFRLLYQFCGLVCLIKLLLAIPNFAGVTSTSSFSDISKLISGAELPTGVGVFLILNKPQGMKYYLGRYLDILFNISILLFMALRFSRSVIIILLCLFVPYLFSNKVRIAKIVKIIVISTALVMLVSKMFPSAFDFFIEKIQHSLVEISNKRSTWSENDIVLNWRGYENYSELRDFRNSTFVQQLIGKGFGSSIEVGSYIHLVTSEKTLPFLHNGYFTILMKSGLLGVMAVIAYYIKQIIKIHRYYADEYFKKFFLGLNIAMIVISYTIGGAFFGYQIEIFGLVSVYFVIRYVFPSLDLGGQG